MKLDLVRARQNPPEQAKISQNKPEQARSNKTIKQFYTQDQLAGFRSVVKKSEERVEKLLTMEEKISIKLADPEIYSDNQKEELIRWNAKYAEVRKALRKAEEIWEKSQKTLDKALTENLSE